MSLARYHPHPRHYDKITGIGKVFVHQMELVPEQITYKSILITAVYIELSLLPNFKC